jgi:hypothetical protein
MGLVENDTGDWWKLMKILGKTAINSTENYKHDAKQ